MAIEVEVSPSPFFMNQVYDLLAQLSVQVLFQVQQDAKTIAALQTHLVSLTPAAAQGESSDSAKQRLQALDAKVEQFKQALQFNPHGLVASDQDLLELLFRLAESLNVSIRPSEMRVAGSIETPPQLPTTDFPEGWIFLSTHREQASHDE